MITFITGEPEVGEGWEFCDIEQATEATIFLAGAKVWSIWKSVKDYRCNEWEPVNRNLDGSVSVPCGHYYYCRHITKSSVEAESLWVVCTAEEAKFNPVNSEWLVPSTGDWEPCVNDIDDWDSDFAYRTKTKLSDWVSINYKKVEPLIVHFRGRQDSDGNIDVLRSSIPVGTVLG